VKFYGLFVAKKMQKLLIIENQSEPDLNLQFFSILVARRYTLFVVFYIKNTLNTSVLFLMVLY